MRREPGGRKAQAKTEPSQISRDVLSPIAEVQNALVRLDTRIASALAAFDALHGGPITDRFRGLVVTSDQCAELLRRGHGSEVASPVVEQATCLWPPAEGTKALQLSNTFGLTQFDLDALLIAIASEFDLRYERLFAYLQDDVTRKRPTVDLLLTLLCSDNEARFAARGRLANGAPLLSHSLVRLVSDPNFLHPPLLAQFVSPDEHMVRWVLSAAGLHSELAGYCVRETSPHAGQVMGSLPAAAQEELTRLAASIVAKRATVPIWLHSPVAGGTVATARAVAQAAGLPLLMLDGSRVLPSDAERLLRLSLREAWLGGDLLCIDHADRWLEEPYVAARLAAALREPMCPVLLGAARSMPAELLGVALPIALPMPDTSQRKHCWLAELACRGIQPHDKSVDALATRFRLTPSQISAAVADAALRSHGAPSRAALEAAARAQSGDALATVADKVDSRATWDDIVLPPDALAQLHELCNRVEQHDRVFNEWGFGRKLSRGRGTTALFSGGSGTGKTMAAEVIANALGLDLYRIDLARVVNKYIGETEKNLDRVFAAAERANAILLFDEADALFGKRSEVKDAHDRYANIEVSYLLQKMEEYDGIAILASNLADNLDEAFTRRLAFAIHFPLPDEAARLEIWRRAWPSAAKIASNLDRSALARELKVAGGSIKNIALGAAFTAAANGGVIHEAHVAHAVQREYEKSGRTSKVPGRFAIARTTASPET